MNEKIKEMAQRRVQEHMETQKRINEVRERFPKVRWPSTYSRPAAYIDGTQTVHIDDRVAIVGETVIDEFNPETQKMETKPHTAFYTFASNQYKIVSHEESLLKMEEILTQLPEYGKPEIKPRIFKDGARMTVLVNFPEVKFEVGPRKENVNPSVELRNSHDLFWEFQVRFGAYQMVCTNGLYAFKEMQKISKKHRQNLVAEDVVQEITDYMGKFSEQIGWWDKWAHRKLDQSGVQEIMDALEFTEKRSDEIKQLPLMGRGAETIATMKEPTFWDVNSAITQFLTHNVESDQVRIEIGERVPTVLQQHFLKAA